MNTKDVGFKKGISKSDLEDCIEDAEANFGPLIKLAAAKGGTVATLNRDEDSPDKKAEVILDPERTAECASPKEEVCKGEAYISGVRQKVLVCR